MSLLNPRFHVEAFRELFGLLTRHRQLTWEMTKREITERYAGQVLGTLWAVGHPMILMGVYVFIFAYIFPLKSELIGTPAMPLDFTAYLLCGVIPWIAFQESMAKGATVITNSANLVKQVVFPIEILPVKGVIVAMITQIISTFFLIAYVLVSHGALPVTYLLLPPLLFLQTLCMIGVSYVFSSAGVYFRDLKDFIQVFCTIGLYIAPIIYVPIWIPKGFMPIIYANPFSYMIWCYQDACYYGRFEHPWAWLVFGVMSLGVFYVGYRIFRKLKQMFGNVL